MAHTDSTDKIRKHLEQERVDLQDEMEVFPIDNQNESTDYGLSQHPADNATDLFLREQNIPLRNSIQDRIDQINAALERLDAGTYGICARCGQPINPERLEVKPSATLCVNCQAVVEQQGT